MRPEIYNNMRTHTHKHTHTHLGFMLLEKSYLFVMVPRPGDSEVNFSVFESSCHLLLPVQPLKGRGNPVKCLAQGHNKRTCRHISTISLLMLNAKQGSCEYQLLKYFSLTRPGNRTQV